MLASKVKDIQELRTERYWRVSDPAQRVLYSWLTGEDPPTGDPKPRRQAYAKTAAKRRSRKKIAA